MLRRLVPIVFLRFPSVVTPVSALELGRLALSWRGSCFPVRYGFSWLVWAVVGVTFCIASAVVLLVAVLVLKTSEGSFRPTESWLTLEMWRE